METIGVRLLKQQASRYLVRVEQGEKFTVTDRGRPVALLVPVGDDPWSQIPEAEIEAEFDPPEEVEGDGPTASEWLLVLREQER